MSFKQFIISSIVIMSTLSYSFKEVEQQLESSEASPGTKDKSAKTTKYDKIQIGSYINWHATHLGGIDPRIGKIYCEEAIVLVNDGKVTNAIVTINMDKMTVDNLPEEGALNLTDHLKSEDFFHIEKHPTSKFEFTKSESIEGAYNSLITGNLTLLGVSKSISFKANIAISDKEVQLISKDFLIDRGDWNMTYNAKGTLGVPLDYLISDNIRIKIKLHITK